MELNYKSLGQGDPIIILHGLFGSLDNWQTIAKQLAEQYTVFTLDLRNHGRSPHSSEHDYSLMAEDVFEFMSNNWIYDAHVIGHSMGGKVAMRLALDYPDQVKKLVVVDMGVKANEGSHQMIFDAMLELDLPNLKTRKVADLQFQTRIKEYGVRQFLLKNLKREKEGYRWKMNVPVLIENYEEILAEIESDTTFDNPTLFLRGGLSDYIKKEDLSVFQTLFPDSELQTIEQAGHWVHAEAPVEFLERVSNFLKED